MRCYDAARLERRRAYKIQKTAEWRAANPEKDRANASKYYQENKERLKTQTAAWQEENKDRVKATTQAWRKRNPEKVKQYEADWSKRNAETRAKHTRDRRARSLGSPGSHTKCEWEQRKVEFGNTCPGCGATGKLSLDHVVPLNAGGSHDIENIQPLCKPCNSKKSDKFLIAYLPWEGAGPRISVWVDLR